MKNNNLPLKSIIFNCLLLTPAIKHFGSLLNQARELIVSETPASASGLTDSDWLAL